MKHGYFKKAAALLLAMLLLAAVPLSAGAAAKADPVIFIPEMTEIVLYQNAGSPNTESVVFDPAGDETKTHITDILGGLLQASAADDVKQGAAKISSVIDEIFLPILCDENGNPENTNVSPRTYRSPVANNVDTPIYTDNIASYVTAAKMKLSAKEIFVFQYDWRIDPSENAELLRQYIDWVKSKTGKSKVSLVTCGYGGVIANAYMYFYGDTAKKSLSNCAFLDSLVTGSSIVGDVMSGDLIRTVSDSLRDIESIFDITDVYDTIKGTDVGNALSRYFSSDPTGILESTLMNLGATSYASLFSKLAISLASFIIEDQGMFTKLGSGYREILMKADDYIYDAGLREYMRNMPGLWAIVPEDSYEQALYFMFGRKLTISDELKEKINRSRAVMDATENTLKKMQRAGVNVCAVAGYNLQILPITSSLLEQSDGLQATRYAGIGATTGDMKHNLKLSKQCENGRHNHMAPGKEVDASTCYLPENTWFIKNHEHNDFKTDTLSSFIVWLSTADGQRNVWQSNLYPQYLQKSQIGDTVTALSKPTNGATTTYTYGDLNFDGSINAADARLALRYAVGLEGNPSYVIQRVGDVDGSGSINAADARLILRYAVGLETGFSAIG